MTTADQTQPTPTESGIERLLASFDTLADSLDYAAKGKTGYNIYSGRGELTEKLPYAKLSQQARELARKLIKKGMKKGDRLAVVAESDGDFARIFYACQYAGIIPAPLPLPVAFGGKELYIKTLHGLITNSSARAVVVPEIIGGWTQEILEGVKCVDVFGGSPAELLALPAADDIELPKINGDDIAYLQFSSGSTRFPKGVAVTQTAAMANIQGIARAGLQVVDGDRAVSWLPLYHDMGLIGFFFTPMCCQFSVDFLPTREFARRPHIWLELMSRNKASIAYSPSFGYELCARRGAREEIDLSRWRVAGIGGDMIRPHILAEFAKEFSVRGYNAKAFVASYGMAETTLAMSFAPLNVGIRTDIVDLRRLESENKAVPVDASFKGMTRELVLCGPALPGHKLEVRDQATGKPLGERLIGRIYAWGPSLMKEYFDCPDDTAEVLSKDGWLDTGDLGYFCDGQIVISGRAKDLIIINARNIWPQDLEWAVEHAVSTLRSRDVAVFAMERDGKETVVTLVQCRLSDPDARAKLIKEVSDVLKREHGVDAFVKLVPPRTLPQTSSGKLSRARARAMLVAGEFDEEQG